MKKTLLKFAGLTFALLLCGYGYAQKKTFTRECTYRASENDSKNAARTAAVQKVQALLMQDVGQVLRAEPRLKKLSAARTGKEAFSEDFFQKVMAVAADVVELKILEEDWVGGNYYIEARMTVDANEVSWRVNESLNDKPKAHELEELRKLKLAAEAEVERLKRALAQEKSKNSAAPSQAYQRPAAQRPAVQRREYARRPARQKQYRYTSESAQRVKFGVRAGLNLAQVSERIEAYSYEGEVERDTTEASSMNPGFYAGAFTKIPFGEHFGLQAEVNFSLQGGKMEESEEEDGYKRSSKEIFIFNYINVPVLFEVKPVSNLSIFAGPQVGINIYKSFYAEDKRTYEGQTKTETEYVSNKDFDNDDKIKGYVKISTVDFAAVAGLQCAIGSFLIDARYSYGFTPIMIPGDKRKQEMKEENVSYKNSGGANRVLQIGIGFTF